MMYINYIITTHTRAHARGKVTMYYYSYTHLDAFVYTPKQRCVLKLSSVVVVLHTCATSKRRTTEIAHHRRNFFSNLGFPLLT